MNFRYFVKAVVSYEFSTTFSGIAALILLIAPEYSFPTLTGLTAWTINFTHVPKSSM